MSNSKTTRRGYGVVGILLLGVLWKLYQSRTQNGASIEVAGVYSLLDSAHRVSIDLTYNKLNDITGNCDLRLKEIMFFGIGSTFTFTWNHYEGQGLKYKEC